MHRSLRLLLGAAALLAVSLDVTRAQILFADNAPAQEEVQQQELLQPQELEQEAALVSEPPVAISQAAERTGAPEDSSWLTKLLYSIYTPPKQTVIESDGSPVSVTMQYPPEIYFFAFLYFSVGLLLIVGPFAYSAGKPRAYRAANQRRS